MTVPARPRLLVIDDLFGRRVSEGRNRERADLCGQLLLQDVSDDSSGRLAPRVPNAVADAVFVRGQTPPDARVGDMVENDLDDTMACIRSGWATTPAAGQWALILLDLCFKTGLVTVDSHTRTPGMPEGRPEDDEPRRYFGLRLLERITEECPDLPVVILSAQERSEVSKQYSENLARGFLERDKATPETFADYLWTHGLIPDRTGQILGQSKAILLALRRARNKARSRGEHGWNNILLRGERGTGKELFARFIHANTDPASTPKRPLVVVDSGAISPTLYKSELFGHKKGAFTDARADRIGRIVQADGGDLLLDEIGNMPAEVQAGLLRVLQERVVVPLGSEEGRRVNVRFLSATNLDIESAGGTFRAELLDRLTTGGTIVLPPLRERKDDIPLLAEHFIREAERHLPRALRRELTPEALTILQEHDWPGNVRELRSCLVPAVHDNPDVEHLVPGHLAIGRTRDRRTDGPESEAESRPVPTRSAIDGGVELENLIRSLNEFSFDGARVASLSGKLPALHATYARLVARYLSAVLRATRKVTPRNTDGAPAIHPAMKLAQGDETLTASKAADLVKRFLGLAPGDIEDELKDLILRQALERAKRLRPSKASGSPKPAGRKGADS